MIGVIRWIAMDRIESGEGWRGWLQAELKAVVAREPGERSVGPVVIRETDTEQFPYGEKLRPPVPARLFTAVVVTEEVPD